MTKKISFVLGLLLFIFCSQLFISSSFVKTSDNLHQQQFNNKYGVYSIIKPKDLLFANEKCPSSSPEIFERIDKELLKNTYWQSNTLLYFKRANKFFPMIEEILEENNIPDDFKYLALIESGLENVFSPSGAAGFWQIMKGTGREYGLEVNYAIDERFNLEKSTRAACKYLQKAHDRFGSWTLAAASYNMGISGLKRKMKSQSTDNYYDLHLNNETSRYVFRILVVKEILENPSKYGFVLRENDLYTFPEVDLIMVDSTIADLNKFALSKNINYKILKQFNPWLRVASLPDRSRRTYYIKIPRNKENLVFKNSTLENLN